MFNIVTNDHACTQKCNFCVCLKSKTPWGWTKNNFYFVKLLKPLAFAGFLHPLREVGAKKYFTDHHTPSVKCTTVTVGYAETSSNISFLPIQAMQAMTMDRLDENKPLPNAFQRI